MLSKEVERIIEGNIGIPLSAISNMDLNEEITYVEERIKRPLIFPKKADKRILSQGNPLIFCRKICTMQDIDKKIEELK